MFQETSVLRGGCEWDISDEALKNFSFSLVGPQARAQDRPRSSGTLMIRSPSLSWKSASWVNLTMAQEEKTTHLPLPPDNLQAWDPLVSFSSQLLFQSDRAPPEASKERLLL